MEVEITKMTSRGQVVIPQDIREEACLKEGEKFLVYDVDGNIILKRIKNIGKVKSTGEFENVFASLWKTARQKGIAKQDVEKEIGAYRAEKHA